MTKDVTIRIPRKFKWMARQPTGEWLFTVKKPRLTNNGDYYPENPSYGVLAGKLIQWWATDGEYAEFDFGSSEEIESWHKSLRRI